MGTQPRGGRYPLGVALRDDSEDGWHGRRGHGIVFAHYHGTFSTQNIKLVNY